MVFLLNETSEFYEIVLRPLFYQISIFGYPTSVFPPTDFHSATLVENDVFLIGNLGYPDDRVVETQVLRLNVETLQISSTPTTGEHPGWLHDHTAVYNATNNTIQVTGGKRCSDRITENFHDYELCLNTFAWKIAKKRNWRAWILEREDGDLSMLWQIRP